MIKKAYSRHSVNSPSRSAEAKSSLQLVSSDQQKASGRYRVRVGNKVFEGDDTRHLLKLAVRARLAQHRALTESPC